MCACVRLILVLVGKKYVRVIAKFCFSATTVPGMIQFTYYVPDTYVPGISRQKSIRTYVVVRMIPTFRPWTHTSDDSYIYQLSLVVATATVSYRLCTRPEFPALCTTDASHREVVCARAHKNCSRLSLVVVAV